MQVKVLRGLNQIGGNIIEVSTVTTKILLDVGLELDDEKNEKLPDIDGLFEWKGYDAVFISHYHGDHIGLAKYINKDIPVYLGEKSHKIIKASDTYKGETSITPTGFMKHKKTIQICDIAVTPYLCDHSAFDSYMIMVEADGESILYTGDFRSGGRKPFNALLKYLPKVNTLICEGTTLSREEVRQEDEDELEKKATAVIEATNGPVFVLMSSMNIDRIVTAYRAAKRCGRMMLQDLYLAEITSSIREKIPNPKDFNDVKVFLTNAIKKDDARYGFRYNLFSKYGSGRISKEQITEKKFVMCIRVTMLDYIKSLNKKMSFDGGILFYSFWSGYRKDPSVKNFLKECEKMGLKIEPLHISGHADPQTIRKLIKHTSPDTIIPVHTENASWFEKEYQTVKNIANRC